jgi:hypothetical protein
MRQVAQNVTAKTYQQIDARAKGRYHLTLYLHLVDVLVVTEYGWFASTSLG